MNELKKCPNEACDYNWKTVFDDGKVPIKIAVDNDVLSYTCICGYSLEVETDKKWGKREVQKHVKRLLKEKNK